MAVDVTEVLTSLSDETLWDDQALDALRIAMAVEAERRTRNATAVVRAEEIARLWHQDNPAPLIGDSGHPLWERPTGAHNVYARGVTVEYNGKVWDNPTHPANSWEPGAVGSPWVQRVGEPAEGEFIMWGPGQAVKVNDERAYMGRLWRARVEHTTHAGWVPSTATYAVWEDLGALPTAPTNPEPTDPEPTDPEPTDPEPTDPEPTDPEPTVIAWASGQVVAVGDQRSHNGHLWRAKTAHTTHDGWAPSVHTHAVWEDLGAL